jgi:hypothetical protein|tara:strand:- start:412 stop:864 length:453 start_codon:yes stop_codon:yes gene_type:complete
MKLEQLRKIIREEVRAAVKAELQDMLTEAVKVASTPNINDSKNSYREVKQKDLKRTWSTGELNTGTIPLQEMINQTRESMTSDEYRNVINGTSDMVKKPNFASTMANTMGISESPRPMPGIDISQFDFVKKAGAVYNRSIEKDKEKLGIA